MVTTRDCYVPSASFTSHKSAVRRGLWNCELKRGTIMLLLWSCTQCKVYLPPPILVYSRVNSRKRINRPVWTQCGSFWTCVAISLFQRFTQSASVESQETDAPGVSPMNKRGPPPGEQEKKKTTFKVHRRSSVLVFYFCMRLFVCLLGLGVNSSSRGRKLHCAGPWPRNFAKRFI